MSNDSVTATDNVIALDTLVTVAGGVREGGCIPPFPRPKPNPLPFPPSPTFPRPLGGDR